MGALVRPTDRQRPEGSGRTSGHLRPDRHRHNRSEATQLRAWTCASDGHLGGRNAAHNSGEGRREQYCAAQHEFTARAHVVHLLCCGIGGDARRSMMRSRARRLTQPPGPPVLLPSIVITVLQTLFVLMSRARRKQLRSARNAYTIFLMSQESISLLSWNIQSGGFNGYEPHISYPERERAILHTINSAKADVAVLVDAHRWHTYYGGNAGIAQHLGYDSAHYAALDDARLNVKHGSEIGIVIATNLPHEVMPLHLGNRNALAIETAIGSSTIRIAGVYFDDLSEKTRLTNAKHLVASLGESTPFVAAGDFNMLRHPTAQYPPRLGDWAVRGLAWALSKEHPLGQTFAGMDTREVYQYLLDSGYSDSDPSGTPTFPSIQPFMGLDYMLSGNGAAVHDLHIGRTRASDHNALLAQVSLTRKP